MSVYRLILLNLNRMLTYEIILRKMNHMWTCEAILCNTNHKLTYKTFLRIINPYVNKWNYTPQHKPYVDIGSYIAWFRPIIHPARYKSYVNIWNNIAHSALICWHIEPLCALWTHISRYGTILRNINYMSTYETILRILKSYIDIWIHTVQYKTYVDK